MRRFLAWLRRLRKPTPAAIAEPWPPREGQPHVDATVTQRAGCPRCGSALWVKSGRRGLFLGCRRYPACRYTRDYPRGEEPTT